MSSVTGSGKVPPYTATEEATGFQQIACRVQIHFRAELEVLLRAAGDEGSEMEYDVDLGCNQRSRELRIGDVAVHGACESQARLVGSHDICLRLQMHEGAHECGTDIARSPGDEYSHGPQLF